MRKLFSVLLVLLVCFTTVFAGCMSEDTSPKSAQKHFAKTVWVYDDNYHWQECSDANCGIDIDINNYYGQKTYITKIMNLGWLPKVADTPDAYARLLGFADFNAYLEEYDEGKAPHHHIKEVKDEDGNTVLDPATGRAIVQCICGHTAVKGA